MIRHTRRFHACQSSNWSYLHKPISCYGIMPRKQPPFPSDHDYALDPSPYKALKTEQGVFTTPPYSAALKPLWRFADEAAAIKSSQAIWERFIEYRDKSDFIGMDISRKFIQMGRTRSLRYALRRSGRKYDPSTGKEMERTGEVYDVEKSKGARVFERVLETCWGDDIYSEAFEAFRRGERMKTIQSESKKGKRNGNGEIRDEKDVEGVRDVKEEEEDEDESDQVREKKRTTTTESTNIGHEGKRRSKNAKGDEGD